jgi:shikimate kinase
MAKFLAQELDCEYASLKNLEKLVNGSDILISCIPESIPELRNASFGENLVFVEANYKKFHLQRKQKKEVKRSKHIGGLDWLFFQASSAFQIFTGMELPVNFKRSLRKSLHSIEINKKPHIALIGFMGAGKTTIGQLLAEELGCEFIDTDNLIQQLSGQVIPEIFASQGESAFRKLEKSVIHKILQDAKFKVVSFGGGAVMDNENRALINDNCLTIWLWASIPEVLKRINFNTRPLLESSLSVKKADQLMAERKPFYARLAELVVSAEKEAPQLIARSIKDEIDKAF